MPHQRPSGGWALPFQQQGSDRAPPAAPPVSRLAVPVHADVDVETMRSVQTITLAQYARICASMRDYPEQLQQIRSHYGLTQHAWDVLHRTWNERFQRDPALKARWQALVARSARR